MSVSDLPEILQDIADVTSREAALAIARVQGGRVAYIPGSCPDDDDHWLVQAVGRDHAEKICDFYVVNGGGVQLLIPMAECGKRGETHKYIQYLLSQGQSAAVIARRTGLHIRTIYRHKKAMKATVSICHN